MANLRLLYDNAADRATLAASSTSGALAASNLQKSERAAIWRSTATTATLTATWATAESVDAVVLGWTNLTALATVTVKLYANAGDTTPISTTVSPDAALALGDFAWGIDPLVMGAAQAAQVASQPQIWIASGAAVKKIEIIIADPLNPHGYIDISRLSIGMRYEMAVNPKYGARLSFIDRSKVSRAESGDVRAETQGIYRTLDLDFEYLESADAQFLMRLAGYGKSQAVFVSLFPDAADTKQQAYAFFATRSGNQSAGYTMINRWNSSLTLEEIA